MKSMGWTKDRWIRMAPPPIAKNYQGVVRGGVLPIGAPLPIYRATHAAPTIRQRMVCRPLYRRLYTRPSCLVRLLPTAYNTGAYYVGPDAWCLVPGRWSSYCYACAWSAYFIGITAWLCRPCLLFRHHCLVGCRYRNRFMY